MELDDLGQTGACRVVVAYEDVASRNSAMELCARLFQKFHNDLEFQADWWAFRYLGTPEFGDKAAGSAADSDVLIVSADSQGEFPIDIKYWFELWISKLSNREHPDSALVSLVLPGAQRGAAKESYLKSVAHRANVDYLCLGGAGPAPTTASAEIVAHMAETMGTPERRFHIPDWGINE